MPREESVKMLWEVEQFLKMDRLVRVKCDGIPEPRRRLVTVD